MAPMTHSVLSRNWSKVQVCRINLIQSYKLPPSINNQGQTDRVAILAEPNPWPWTILASYSHDLYRCKKSRSKVTWFKRYSGNRQIDEHNQVQYQGWIQGFASVGHPLFLPFSLAVWSPPLIPARGFGECFKLAPQGLGRKRIWCTLKLWESHWWQSFWVFWSACFTVEQPVRHPNGGLEPARPLPPNPLLSTLWPVTMVAQPTLWTHTSC